MSLEDTQRVFASLIEKPQLTIDLLSRPPFKFIVDIVTNVIKTTGYLKNDFTTDELRKASDDKNSKVTFLEKLIKLLDDGSLVNVKVSKIISGKEAEQTNIMLQKLGSNAIAFKSSKSLKGDEKKAVKSSEKAKLKEKKNKRHKKLNEELEQTGTDGKMPKVEVKEHKQSLNLKSHIKSSDKKTKELTRSVKAPKEVNDFPNTESSGKLKKKKMEPSERVLKRADSMIAVMGDAPNTPSDDFANPPDGEYNEPQASNQLMIHDVENELMEQSTLGNVPLSEILDSEIDKNSRTTNPEEARLLFRPTTGAASGRPMTSMGRPGTAASRPAPPKIKKKQISTFESVPQAAIELKSEIISESRELPESEENNNFIIEEDEDKESQMKVFEANNQEDRGILVQKIMDKKAEIEDGASSNQVDESESDKNIAVEKEKVRNLQEKLQDLTKAAYPLARLFDFANDDIESMIKELERWRSEHRKKDQEDQNKKASGFGDSRRLYNIIANLQKEIHDMKEELSKGRGRILNNESRIQLFMANI